MPYDASIFGSLVVNSRRLLDDARAAKFTNDDVGFWLNKGLNVVQGQTKAGKVRRSLALVTNQREYALPADLLEPQQMIWKESDYHTVLTEKTLPDLLMRRTVNTQTPINYAFVDDERTIFIWPTPSFSQITSTLNASMLSTDTTLTLAAGGGGSFPAEGRILIDSEVIQYASKVTDTLNGLTRGLENTAAATHNSAATVTYRDIMLYGILKVRPREMYRYYTTGTVTVTNASATVTGSGTAWDVNLIAGNWIGLTTDATRLDPTVWYQIKSVDSATQVTLTANYNEANGSAKVYIASDASPLPERFDVPIMLYAIGNLLRREGAVSLAQSYLQEFDRALKLAKQEYAKTNQVLIPLGRHDRAGFQAGRYLGRYVAQVYGTAFS